MNFNEASFRLALLKRKNRLIYIHDKQTKRKYPPHTGRHKLKVLSKAEKWGDYWVVKCKVIGKDDWYNIVYITAWDFKNERV